MCLSEAKQKIEEIFSLPTGSYTGVLAEGDYSLEGFPECEQLKRLAKEYWLTRYHGINVLKVPVFNKKDTFDDDELKFAQRELQTTRRLVSDILEVDVRIETILRQLAEEQPGDDPLLEQRVNRDILRLLDAHVDKSKECAPLIRWLKSEQNDD